ncbi:MAG TPA: L,D-transpeptidase [Albitalea sp.]|uniref:L,D-transpeptidase n=1 Tax=Piscinibacter sp. TaxID=1903157 RepID=UPI002ED1A9E2
MRVSRRALCAIALGGLCAAVAPVALASERGSEPTMSADVRFAARWIAETRDNRNLPFAIVDKRGARLFVFGPRGQLIGTAPALLGMARGDHSSPGVGALPPERIPVPDRTTPAGRFMSEPGRNLDGEDVVWFDYEAGLAIHRVRANAARSARLQRLSAAVPDGQRVSAGCVVVDTGFYESVVRPVLGRGKGMVYVLPETRSVQDMFTGLAAAL